jgi:hypothetical protein
VGAAATAAVEHAAGERESMSLVTCHSHHASCSPACAAEGVVVTLS